MPDSDNLVDIVGTGGDGSHTFNISTATMFVTAAAGAKVAKHGNRGVSSKSGSADVLEALGVNIDLQPEQVALSIAETGMGFMFAPNHHPAMKNIAAVRRELGVRTIFNILGPLTNPAGAPNQLMGVFHEDLVGIQVRVMQRLGAKHVLVVYGKDGMDEVSLGADDGGRRIAQRTKFANTKFIRKISACKWCRTGRSKWPTRRNRKPCFSARSTTSRASRAKSSR